MADLRASPRMMVAHANSPHVYVLHTCTHVPAISRCGAAQSSGWPAWARLQQSRTWLGTPSPSAFPARPLLCPAQRGHASWESPHRPQHIPLLCPHRLLAPSHRATASLCPQVARVPWVQGSHRAPGSRSCSCPEGGFAKGGHKLQVKRKEPALRWVWRGSCSPCALDGTGDTTEKGTARTGIRLGWHQDQEVWSPLISHTIALWQGWLQNKAGAAPVPASRGLWAALLWTPTSREAFFSNTGEIFLLISFNTNLYTLQAKHFGNHIRSCRQYGRNLFLFPFLSLSLNLLWWFSFIAMWWSFGDFFDRHTLCKSSQM